MRILGLDTDHGLTNALLTNLRFLTILIRGKGQVTLYFLIHDHFLQATSYGQDPDLGNVDLADFLDQKSVFKQRIWKLSEICPKIAILG